MSCLLYGIVAADADLDALPTARRGVGGAPVRLLEANGLAAAVSRVAPADAAPTVRRTLEFARVVEALHAQRAVIPVRYGCLLEDDGRVAMLLRARATEYAALLRRLRGCVEMAVQMAAGHAEPGDAGGSVCEDRHDSAAHPPGAAYLERRRAAYAAQERCAREHARLSEQVRAALAGRFIECRTEVPRPGLGAASRSPVVTTYFLVQRQALTPFRQAFHQFRRSQPTPLQLSGPWPPYNFVTSEPHGHQLG